MATYPLTSFHFMVEWGGTRIGFSEVKGLNIQTEVQEFRHGASPEYANTKMPGRRIYDNITITRGVFPNDNEFYEWFNTINLNQVERRDIVISLLDENHEPKMVWKVRNAFPIKYIGPVLNAEGGIATESLVFTHEGLTVEKV